VIVMRHLLRRRLTPGQTAPQSAGGAAIGCLAQDTPRSSLLPKVCFNPVAAVADILDGFLHGTL